MWLLGGFDPNSSLVVNSWYRCTLKSDIYKRSIQSPKLHEFDTNFNNFLIKADAFVRKLMGLGAKLRNLFLIFKTPKLGSVASQFKLTHRAGCHWNIKPIPIHVFFQSTNSFQKIPSKLWKEGCYFGRLFKCRKLNFLEV